MKGEVSVDGVEVRSAVERLTQSGTTPDPDEMRRVVEALRTALRKGAIRAAERTEEG